MMPVLEIVFLLAKTEVEENKFIRFESRSGMPLKGELYISTFRHLPSLLICFTQILTLSVPLIVSYKNVFFLLTGEVQFIEEENGVSTTVIFKLEHQLPNLLADVRVNAFGVETSCRLIFTENLDEFRQIAEAMASGEDVKPRTEAEDGVMSVGMELLLGGDVFSDEGQDDDEGQDEDEGQEDGQDEFPNGVDRLGDEDEDDVQQAEQERDEFKKDEAEEIVEEVVEETPPPPPPPPPAAGELSYASKYFKLYFLLCCLYNSFTDPGS